MAVQRWMGLLSQRRPRTRGRYLVDFSFNGKNMSTTMTSDLAKKECKPCDGKTPPLKGDALKQMQNQLGNEWQVLHEQKLERQFKFPDFRSALDFVNEVGEIAEAQNHHPDISFTWGQASIQIWTHSIKGLSEGDFILAAKISELV